MKGFKAGKDLINEAGLIYTKLPIPIKAVQVIEVFWVASLEGDHQGNPGDYLIEGVEGELYICKKEIFEKTYMRKE